jgi:hypothetical protein
MNQDNGRPGYEYWARWTLDQGVACVPLCDVRIVTPRAGGVTTTRDVIASRGADGGQDPPGAVHAVPEADRESG